VSWFQWVVALLAGAEPGWPQQLDNWEMQAFRISLLSPSSQLTTRNEAKRSEVSDIDDNDAVQYVCYRNNVTIGHNGHCSPMPRLPRLSVAAAARRVLREHGVAAAEPWRESLDDHSNRARQRTLFKDGPLAGP